MSAAERVPFRLPQYRDAASKRVVPLRSAQYAVLVLLPDRPGFVSSAGHWPTVAGARAAARMLLGSRFIDRVAVVRPAGLLDDDDHYEEITKEEAQ